MWQCCLASLFGYCFCIWACGSTVRILVQTNCLKPCSTLSRRTAVVSLQIVSLVRCPMIYSATRMSISMTCLHGCTWQKQRSLSGQLVASGVIACCYHEICQESRKRSTSVSTVTSNTSIILMWNLIDSADMFVLHSWEDGFV